MWTPVETTVSTTVNPGFSVIPHTDRQLWSRPGLGTADQAEPGWTPAVTWKSMVPEYSTEPLLSEDLT